MMLFRIRIESIFILVMPVLVGVSPAQGPGRPLNPPSIVIPGSGETPPNAVGEPAPLTQFPGQPTALPTDGVPEIDVSYFVERPVHERSVVGEKVVDVTRYVRETRHAKVSLDADFTTLELPPNGRRAAVLAVTTARHAMLLQKLKDANDDEEQKKAAIEALKQNFTEHYAIETWWRAQKLAELEQRLAKLRSQVQRRTDAQVKYVAAAMTMAELWADGITDAPPAPGNSAAAGEPIRGFPTAPVMEPPAVSTY